jgi:hypothetical protein
MWSRRWRGSSNVFLDVEGDLDTSVGMEETPDESRKERKSSW